MKDQVQKAVDCYNAGATVLHVHVREPDGKGSKRLEMFNEMLDRLRTAVPKMILQVGGSISFAPKDEGEAAKWLNDDTRHMLAELNPAPDQVTIAINTNQMNVMELITDEDCAGTSMGEPDYKHAYTEMYYESGPGFVKEHLKRLVAAGIQPHFMIGSIKDLETVERIVRQGQYMGPYVLNWVAIGGGHDGPNPRNLMEFINRVPQNAVLTVEGLMRSVYPLCTHGHRDGPARARRPGGQSLGPPRRARDVGPADREDGEDFRGAVAADRDRRPGARNLQDRHLLLSVDETLEKNGWLPNRKPCAAQRRGMTKQPKQAASRRYAWVVFALTFGLLISDYMARQVLNAVFPLLKAEWALSDGQLGLLSGVVALMVGLLTFPLSLLADRWGRVRSLTAMAVLWSLATLLCGLAAITSRCWPAACSSGSAKRPTAASASPSSSASSPSAAGDAFGGLHGRRAARPGAGSASAARRRGPWLAHGLPRDCAGGLLLGLLYPLLVGEQRLAHPPRPADREVPARARLSKAAAAVCRAHAQMRLCRQRLQLFVAGRAAGLAADLFQPLL
jgi:uncharacterized protein (DUF849 family)